MIEVVAFAPFLRDYGPWLEEQVRAPIRVRVSPSFREEDVIPLLSNAEIALASHWSVRLGQAARTLRFLQIPGAGWDKIDPDGIPPGVLVANCYEHEKGIGEWVMMMCLALSRHLIDADRTIRMGVWQYFPAIGQSPFYKELGGQTIGLIGLGRIGREVARLAASFGMRRIAVDVDPLALEAGRRLGLDSVSTTEGLSRLLADSDFVVLTLPLFESTSGLINRERLHQMRPSAFLINPARAEICDECDLYEALRDRVIAGAAIDTWWRYPEGDEVVPPSRYPYQSLGNVIMSPHASGSTETMLRRRMRVVAENLTRFIRGEPVTNIVAELSRVDEIHPGGES